jgi:hypothetical protein
LLSGICDADTGEVVSDRQYFSLSKVFEALGELAPRHTRKAGRI